MDCSLPGSSCPWDFPGKNTGVGSHFFLQGIFPTQRVESPLLHWQAGFFTAEAQESPSRSTDSQTDEGRLKSRAAFLPVNRWVIRLTGRRRVPLQSRLRGAPRAGGWGTPPGRGWASASHRSKSRYGRTVSFNRCSRVSRGAKEPGLPSRESQT